MDVDDLTDLHMIALGVLRMELAATVDDVAELLAVDEPDAQRLLDDLERAGLVAAHAVH